MPRKPITPSQLNMAVCYSIMSAWQFSYDKRLEWEIYGSRHQPCSICGSSPYSACLNLADIRFNSHNPPDKHRVVKQNKRPHDARIDWEIILQGLKTRGYYRAQLEAQVRKQIREPVAREFTSSPIDDDPQDKPDWAKD